jgi:hypothetical protein
MMWFAIWSGGNGSMADVLSKYLKEYDIAMPALLQQRRRTLEIAGKAGGVATKKTHGKQSGGVGNT